MSLIMEIMILGYLISMNADVPRKDLIPVPAFHSCIQTFTGLRTGANFDTKLKNVLRSACANVT
jgi:hypothetical protein